MTFGLDPLSATLTAGTVAGNLIGGAASRRQAAENLAFQKWLANEELRMGQASRVDAMGNTVRYDKALNKWVTDLSPEQFKLSKAGEHEQQLSLTDDAAQNRQIRERAFRRGMDSSEDYERERADYNYGNNPSEGSIQNDIAGLMLRGRAPGGGGIGGTRQFLRQRGNLPVVSSSGSNSAVSDIADALLQSRSGALGERGQRQQQRSAKLPGLQSLAAMSDAGGGANVQFPDFSKLFSAEGDMSKGLLGAAEAGGKGVGSAYQNAQKAATSGIPSLGDTTRAIAALRGQTPGKSAVAPTAAPDSRSLDEILYGF